MRDALSAEANEVLLADLVARHDVRRDPVRHERIGNGDDRAFDDGGVSVERALDLAELDPISATLDLVVPTTEQPIVAVRLLTYQIARPIDRVATSIPKRVGYQAAFGPFLVAPVALHHGGPADVQLPDLSRASERAVVRHGEHLDVRDGSPDGDGLRLVLGDRAHGVVGAHVRLGRAVEVEERDVRQELHQPAQELRREDLAGEEDGAQLREIPLLQTASKRQHAQQRWDRVRDGQAPLLDEPLDLRREHGELGRNQDDRRPRSRGGEEIEDRQIEMERRVARQPVLSRNPEPLDRPSDERERVQVREHDALRGPRGA